MKLARTVAGAALAAVAVAGATTGLLMLGTAGATSGRRAEVDAPPAGAEATAAAAPCGRPLGVVADAVGLPVSEVRQRVRAGETVAQIAAAQGVDRQVVVDELVAAGQARIDRGVQAGRLTDAQAARRQATLPARVAAAVDNPITTDGGGGGSAAGRRPGTAAARRARAQLAAALGMSPAELRQARAAGQSVAEIAESRGLDRQQVIDTLVARATERITALVDGDTPAGRCG